MFPVVLIQEVVDSHPLPASGGGETYHQEVAAEQTEEYATEEYQEEAPAEEQYDNNGTGDTTDFSEQPEVEEFGTSVVPPHTTQSSIHSRLHRPANNQTG